MNRTTLLWISALAVAALAPLAAAGQVNQEAAPATEQGATYKYEAYLGGAYSRIRQVPVTYSGLLGGKMSLTRDWGNYFQLTGSLDYYKKGVGHSFLPNPGNPSIYSVMAAPGVHLTLYENISGKIFAELGIEHTGSENMSPSTSLAGGFGGGLVYGLGRRFSVQLIADRVGASFSLPNNSPSLGYSPHKTWNARATLGVGFRF